MLRRISFIALTIILFSSDRVSADAPTPVAAPFPLSAIRLTDPALLAERDANARYLLRFDVDRILWLFRRQAGLPHPGEPLHGWEHPGAGAPGMFHGHYLSACAMMYASTGDAQWKDRVAQIVSGLAECQQADGYLSTFPESKFDHIETTPADGSIPYYTIHKVMAGLFDAYAQCDNAQALDVLEHMAKYFAARNAKLSDAQRRDNVWPREFGGMNETAWNLFGVRPSGEARSLATFFDQESLYDPLSRGEDNLRDKHANTYVPKVIGAARRYELTGEERYRDAAEFFWHTVVDRRAFCTGGTCVGEHWRGEPGELADQLGYSTQETCVTYNLLKLTRHLFAWQPRAELFDYYERAFYSSILGSQEPTNGTKLYHLSLKPGGYKLFGDPEDSLWCCFGSGVENFSKLGDSTYFCSPDGQTLWVNLFIDSTLTWTQRGVSIRQSTTFPNKGETTLTVNGDQPATFGLRVRMPDWATGVTFAINDTQFAAAQKGNDGYFEVSRRWQPGDRMRVRLPMRLHVERMPDDLNLVALMYGPIVLAGELSDPIPLADRTVPHRFPLQELRYEQGAVVVPGLVAVNDASLAQAVTPVEGQPLTFKTSTTNGDVILRPLGQTTDRHYTVYWRRFAPGTPALVTFKQDQTRDRAQARVTIDSVDVGEFVSEIAHGFKGERSNTGKMNGEAWRDASAGGSFSYQMKLDPDGANVLVCRYSGNEGVPREFEVLIDDRVVGRQKLGPGRAGWVDVRYPIPVEQTRGKDRVTVRFRGVGERLVGGVCDVRIVRS